CYYLSLKIDYCCMRTQYKYHNEMHKISTWFLFAVIHEKNNPIDLWCSALTLLHYMEYHSFHDDWVDLEDGWKGHENW
ncbi:hypothetical protein ACJX0J_018852, partial [Zea mays]